VAKQRLEKDQIQGGHPAANRTFSLSTAAGICRTDHVAASGT
jgi:hypothetical protein